jgi:SP family sugar:H+ symporter-like MFS transporter
MYGYVFAGCLFLAAALVYFGVIEGAGRTLEELDTMYVMRVKPWESSKYELPEELPEDLPTAATRRTGSSSENTAIGDTPHTAGPTHGYT